MTRNDDNDEDEEVDFSAPGVATMSAAGKSGTLPPPFQHAHTYNGGHKNPSKLPYFGVLFIIISMTFLYLYLRFFEPPRRPNSPRMGGGWTLGCFLVLDSLLFWTLYRLASTDPGCVDPAEWGELVDQSKHICFERKRNGTRRFCRKTRLYKPDRAHFCRATRRLILRYDHHCIFVDASIGLRNHKYFIQFLMYASAACLIVALDLFLNTGVFERAPIYLSPVTAVTSTLVLVEFVLTAAFSLSLLGFGGFHIFLIAHGTTTLEFSEKEGRAIPWNGRPYGTPYNTGLANNFTQVFGTRKLAWLLPLEPVGLSDGIKWNMVPGMEPIVSSEYVTAKPGRLF